MTTTHTTPLADAYRHASALAHVHVTTVLGANVYGHTSEKCDPAGCDATELFFSDLDGDACAVGGIVPSGDPEADRLASEAFAAWLGSDEIREWYFGGDSFGGGRERGHWHAPSLVAAALHGWASDGDYDRDRTIVLDNFAEPIDPDADSALDDERVTVETTIDPEEPRCTPTRDHDWQTPHSVLGGNRDNPGAFSTGGGIRSTEICARCGIYKTVDSGATNPSNGKRMTSTRYSEADEDSLGWIERNAEIAAGEMSS